ncbi:MAG TPA: cupin domain-containing protein [bacterium]|nr:cupin domain-containing protein [bacterium]
MTAGDLVRDLGLLPHPEGGFYRETYRAAGTTPTASGGRAHSTCIYYLLVRGAKSRLHRLASDEVFHFYLGDPVTWVLLKPEGGSEEKTLGPRLDRGQSPQMVVSAGTWFGGELAPGGSFALMGTTVAPGFDFADFELADPEALARDFPAAQGWIARLA